MISKTRFLLGTALFAVVMLVAVGCGKSVVTSGPPANEEQKDAQLKKYMENATPEQKAQMEENMKKMKN